MELRQLRYFVAVAEELHFGRAARRLHMAQPPLSQAIKQLESELGATLLARTSRRVELTDAGRLLLDEARRTLAQADRAATTARLAAQGATGWLRLAFVASAACDILPSLLPAQRAAAPDVSLQLRELTTERQIDALDRDEVDLGIAREVEAREGLVITPLRDEPLVAALPADHPQAARAALALRELADEPFVMTPRRAVPRLHDTILALCRAAGFSPRVVQEALQFPTILSLVSAGVGAAIVPAPVAAFRSDGVAYVPLSDRDAQSAVAFVHRADHEGAVLRSVLDRALTTLGAPPQA